MKTHQKGQRLFTYAVIADTHLNHQEQECNSPFEVNKLANARLRYVIEDLNSRDISHVIHLGDVVHPVPSMGILYSDSAARFKEQIAPLKHPLFIIPGNHDVGDKPIKWGPAGTVRQSFLDAWKQYFGAHYFKHIHGDMVFLGINAQVFGSGLPLETEQMTWLAHTLELHKQQRICLFTHYPPFLLERDEDEHYDNFGLTGRRQLLGLLDRFEVEALFAGHVHHFWYNRFNNCECFLLPSTCFTRQDYSEMFRVGPAPEHGRNDADKLGFMLVHVHEHGQLIEMVRSYGNFTLPDAISTPTPRRLEPVNATTNRFPVMGFDLRHDWCERVQIPPSGGLEEFDRKWVRNDYGLLALWEMGVRHLRIPAKDLQDPERKSRLDDLAKLGFRFSLYSFGQPDATLSGHVQQSGHLLESWEIGFHPDDLESFDLAAISDCRNQGIKVFASPLRSKAEILSSGKQYFHVINHGFTLQDRDADGAFQNTLTERQEFKDLFDGIVLRCALDDDIGAILELADKVNRLHQLETILHLRLTADNPGEYQQSEATVCRRLTEAMCQAWTMGDQKIFCDSFTDNDRGYFPRHGVLDRKFNPRSGFHLVKGLHGLFNLLGTSDKSEATIDSTGSFSFTATCGNQELKLVMPDASAPQDKQPQFPGDIEKCQWIDWGKAQLVQQNPNQSPDFPIAHFSRFS